jgi:hypothetical protein
MVQLTSVCHSERSHAQRGAVEESHTTELLGGVRAHSSLSLRLTSESNDVREDDKEEIV